VEPRHKAVTPEARPRLSRQNRAVLLMLRGGPRTNAELASVALHYNARVYDLRGAGCVIDCDHDPASGRAVYTLRHEPEGLA
jgi:hypothetical protein